MISDTKVDKAAEQIETILQRMIDDGADSYALQRAIFSALAMIARRRASTAAATIAGELSTRFGAAIAILRGKSGQ